MGDISQRIQGGLSPPTQDMGEAYYEGAKARVQESEYFNQVLEEQTKIINTHKDSLGRDIKNVEEHAKSMVESAAAAEKLMPAMQKLNDVVKDNYEALSAGTIEGEQASQVAKAFSNAFGIKIEDVNLDKEMQQLLAQWYDGIDGAAEKITQKLLTSGENSFKALATEMGVDAQNLSDWINGLNFDLNGQAFLDDEQILAALAADTAEADKLRAALEAAGIAIDFEWAEEWMEVPATLPKNMMSNTAMTDTGGVTTVRKKIRVPKKAVLTSAAGRQQTINANGGGTSSGGGGGSSKQKYWDNPYDELYNLIERQNEALRTREKLEREYDRILQRRSSSAKELLQNSLDEIANLRKEIAIQEEIQTNRRRMINNLGSTGIYRDEEGNEKTYDQWDVTRYAKYNYNTNTIEIDWAGIDQINDPEVGGAVEAYISKLEELVSSFEDTEDQIEEMQDLIREIKERNMQEYLELEERTYQAIVDREQKIIDEYSNLADAINESNSRVIDNLRESIDMERQIRDNTKTEEDIQDKEARLAYLQRDTSGANQMETLQLQKDIDDARESYTDTLIDQAIDQMQKDNDLAAEQRQHQIDIMQAQLDWNNEHGIFWDETYELINTAFDKNGNLVNNSKLVELLRSTEAFSGMSKFGQKQWMNELVDELKKAYEGLYNWNGQQNLAIGATQTPSETTTPQTSKSATSNTSSNSTSNSSNQKTTRQLTEEVKRGVAGAIWRGQGWGNGNDRIKKLEEVFGKNNGIQALVDAYVGYNDSVNTASAYSYEAMKKYNWKQYAKGGLADFTGPAWLDGTKSAPEMVLSAQDTKNFISLRNALAQMLQNNQMGGKPSGDNYFDIQINVDELADDYDVDKLAERVKKQIYDDSSYRNVNTINYLR